MSDEPTQAVKQFWRTPEGGEIDRHLRQLLDKAKARYDAMTPDQKATHDKAQRESWVRGMTPTGDPRFD